MNTYKKYTAFLLMIMLSFSAMAQKKIDGIWEGTLHANVDIRIVFHIHPNGENYTVALDVPDQGAKDIPASAVRVSKDSISVEIEKIHGSYAGRITDDSTITGVWTQGRGFPLNIKKVREITAVKRPQTPMSPFPYKSEDVVYFNAGKSVRYGATITSPEGKGPFPALLLITGSGQQNRDEEIFQHRPFAVIADYLTRKGYIVMRVDDRGTGQTTGDLTLATSRDFANDAEVSFDYLKMKKEVDPARMGLLGHSEGGMIAQMIAAERKDIGFLVFLAAPGEKTTLLMEEQNAAILRTAGMSQAYTGQYLSLYRSLIPAVTSAPSFAEAKQAASGLVDAWTTKTDKNIVLATTGINSETTKERFINSFVPALYTPWYRYFLSYDPDINLRKIKSKVLALNGDKDIQVIAGTNLPEMKASLKKSLSKDVEIKELTGLNHLFQHCRSCTVQEYGQLEETIAPEVLDTISSWLNAHVK